LAAEKEEKLQEERVEKKKLAKIQEKRERLEAEERRKREEAKSYDRVFKPSKMTSNSSRDVTDVNEAEEDFM